MNKRNIHIVSAKTGSIGEITQDLIEQFKKTEECIITVEGDEEPINYDILLCHFINPLILESKVNKETFDSFKYKVLIQPIDGTSIVKKAVDLFNQFDLIITPGQAGRRILKKNKVTTPIKVIPNFYKKEHIESCEKNQVTHPELVKLEDKIVFYHESTFHPRKGTEFLYSAFIKAFSDTPLADHVVLVCKDMPFNKLTFGVNEKRKKEVIKLQKKYKKPASIVKISQNLNWEQLIQLWRLCDIYVSLSKIEGFGIPLLRMAVLEKKILTLDNNLCGYMDFLTEDNTLFIPSEIVKAEGEFMWLYDENTEWATASEENIIKYFKKAIPFLNQEMKPFDLREKYEIKNVAKQYLKTLLNLKKNNNES